MPNNEIEKKLWESADQLRANSKLKSSQYSVPVLGLIFLRFADHKFRIAQKELEQEQTSRRLKIDAIAYQAKGAIYLPEEARFSHLLRLPESENIGKAINDAMRLIEDNNDDLSGVLPKSYNRINNDTLFALLKNFSEIPIDLEGDVLGKIYEYFLERFAMSEGRRGGEFFTPTSVVKLIVEIIEPFHGRIFDPACGSGGMFVQSAKFVANHKRNPNTDIAIYGQEKVAETVNLCKMNLAIHGLSGEDIKPGNTYYEDIHHSVGKFDFVMANPPFNVDGVNKAKIKADARFPYGLTTVDNANYIWIQQFCSALNENGRAGFVMANAASGARHSEQKIREKIVDDQVVDVMVSVASNFFYTVTLPCTLWFLDKGKKQTDRKEKIVFVDARHIYHQLDRAHREFKPEQLEFLANIVRLYRNEKVETVKGSKTQLDENFPDGVYVDVPGLCKVATLDEIRDQNYSLNPGRYVGVAERDEEDFDFDERFTELNEELELLNLEAHHLETEIAENVARLLEVA